MHLDLQHVWIGICGICASVTPLAPASNAGASFDLSSGAGQVILAADQQEKQQPDERPLLKKAQVMLLAGDVSGARAIYLYLATKGSAAGALGVADTYDPITLKAIPNAGLTGDPFQVETWTRRAKELENRFKPQTAQGK